MTRREFMQQAAFAGAGAMIGGCGTFGDRAPAIAGDFAWGALLHLGFNMWGDWTFDGKYPRTPEEAAKTAKPPEFRKNGSLGNRQLCDYVAADMPTWNAITGCMQKEGLNLVLIDVGEAYAFPSHPEIWVNGAWDADKMRTELNRLRGMGLEPIPKLNFSTGHDIWLKQYHYMTATSKYYEVVADVIRDVCEVFDRPRYFHLGFDEETPAAVKRRAMAVLRQGDLWWHDFNFCVREVERNGARAMLWSDMICAGKETFLKRMSKDVVQMPWYYGTDFSEKNVTWDASFEKKTDWSVQRNLAASIGVLCDAGYDVIPCTSNWSNAKASESMVAYCRDRVPVRRLKGFLTAPWFMTLACQRQKLEEGIRLFADAKRKLYPAKA